jgi:hypothetical protein
VHEAHNGREALAALSNLDRVALLLTDIGLPQG